MIEGILVGFAGALCVGAIETAPLWILLAINEIQIRQCRRRPERAQP